MALAYGPLFLVYVGIGALEPDRASRCCSAGTRRGRARPAFSDRFPRRPMIGFGIFMAVLLAGMWLPLIAQTSTRRPCRSSNGGTTLVVQAFDLGFLVPLGLFTAVTVQRGLAVGYVLSAIVVVKGMAMGAGIASMLIVEWPATGVAQLPRSSSSRLDRGLCRVLAWRVFGSIGPDTANVARGPATVRAMDESTADRRCTWR